MRLFKIALLVGVAFSVGILALSACSIRVETDAELKAELKNASGQIVGSATLVSSGSDDGVKITLRVNGLPPGPHGTHIHAVGKCEPPDFTSAGGHYNPDGKKHGLENPDGPHAGDLPVLVVAPDGTGILEATNKLLTNRPKDEDLLHSGGAALVIHASADDQRTDPTGNSGARIACGVIVNE